MTCILFMYQRFVKIFKFIIFFLFYWDLKLQNINFKFKVSYMPVYKLLIITIEISVYKFGEHILLPNIKSKSWLVAEILPFICFATFLLSGGDIYTKPGQNLISSWHLINNKNLKVWNKSDHLFLRFLGNRYWHWRSLAILPNI